MELPYTKAPHRGGFGPAGNESPHAALLIDFDNVTMGMRSDLSRELKTLLDSDVIKGKVSVQRAYADWRRYPQYIVPLSEASVDLIFAPAYGSSKKNATDIRMAIDGMELVFVRPEIGTFILLTGDSDFSSLVLKLKEYGKYVIGVGIQESSSDILVQNCDEYYSYTSLTGLTKTTDLKQATSDPWVLVADSVKKMVARKDVMRSDRLKQVMQEMDPNFEESGLGFSKFSKFLAEASSRGLVALKKLENGQYEVGVGTSRPRRSSSSEGRGRGGRGDRSRGRRGGQDRETTSGAVGAVTSEAEPEGSRSDVDAPDDPLKVAYGVLVKALGEFAEAGRPRVRDSDVKRKMLAISSGFDETELGFPKFSKFLSQAVEHGVIVAERTERGNYEVGVAAGWLAAQGTESTSSAGDDSPAVDDASAKSSSRGAGRTSVASGQAEKTSPTREAKVEQTVVVISPSTSGGSGLRLGPRGGSTRRRGGDVAPALLEGQIVGGRAAAKPAVKEETPVAETNRGSARARGTENARVDETAGVAEHAPVVERVSQSEVSLAQDVEAPRQGSGEASGVAAADEGPVDLGTLGLPNDPEAIVRYLTHRYKGVGEKTAQTLVERFGSDLFKTMRDDPSTIASAVPAGRAEQVLEAWQADYERRVAAGVGRPSSNRSKGRS